MRAASSATLAHRTSAIGMCSPRCPPQVDLAISKCPNSSALLIVCFSSSHAQPSTSRPATLRAWSSPQELEHTAWLPINRSAHLISGRAECLSETQSVRTTAASSSKIVLHDYSSLPSTLTAVRGDFWGGSPPPFPLHFRMGSALPARWCLHDCRRG